MLSWSDLVSILGIHYWSFIHCKKKFCENSPRHDSSIRIQPKTASYISLCCCISCTPLRNKLLCPKFWTLWVPNPKIPMEFRHKPNPTHIQILVRVWVLPVGTRILGTSQAILPSYFCDCMKRLHTVIKRTSEGKITEEYIPRIQFLIMY